MTKINTQVNGLLIDSLSNGEYAGIVRDVYISSSVTAFQPLCEDGYFSYRPANATSISTMPATCLALETASSGYVKALFLGSVRNTSWSLSSGVIYVGLTDGSLVQGDPDSIFTTTGNIVHEIGRALSTDEIWFAFDKEWAVVS